MRMTGFSSVRWRVRVDTDSEPYWSSYLFCGLYELAATGELALQYRPQFTLQPQEGLCTMLTVTDTVTGAQRRLAFDWRDNADLLFRHKLARADLYFKRNLIPALSLPVCPAVYRAKLRPLGLSFAVRGQRERPLWVQLLAGIWKQERPLLCGSWQASTRNLRRVLCTPRLVQGLRRPTQFEAQTGPGTVPAVFYLVSAYDSGLRLHAADTRAVTEQRAAVIRALRAALPGSFVGGFVDEPYARAAYPDCVSSQYLAGNAYCDRLKSCQLAVYTRGLRQSPAFKLAEYLAAGRCILSEPVPTQLPQPLIDGREIICFGSVDDLVARCRALLADPSRVAALGAAARRYYDTQIQPAAAVRRFLHEAFPLPDSAAGNRPEPLADSLENSVCVL